MQLSHVLDLDIDSRGRIYVADGVEMTIVVLDRDLIYQRRVGRVGEGPGEFRTITSIDLRADSLWVFDSRLLRVTVFDPVLHEVVRVVNFRNSEGFPYWMTQLPANTGYLAALTPTYHASGEDAGTPRTNFIRHIPSDSTGSDISTWQPIFSFPGSEDLVWRAPGQATVANHPFGSVPFLRVLNGNEIVYGTSAAVGATIVDLAGNTRGAFFPPTRSDSGESN